MGNLSVADWAALGLFFFSMLLIGALESRKIRNSLDFFMPRKFGKLLMITFTFGTGTSADQAVGVASKSFTNGLSGIWYQWAWLPITPFYWILGGLFRRFRATTTADIFYARFGLSVTMLYAVMGTMDIIVNLGVCLKGTGEVLSASVAGAVPTNTIVIIMTIVFVAYGVAGGLSAAIITDFIQGMLTIIFSFMLLPSILHAVGGMEGLRLGVGDPAMLSLVAPEEINSFFITVISLNGLLIVMSGAGIATMCGPGRTEMDARYGLMGGNLLKRLCTFPWAIIGLAAAVYYVGKGVTPDQAFGTVASDFLPNILPGLLGIFIAGTLAAVMSSTTALMITGSALLTENIYKTFVVGKSEKHYVNVGRIASVLVVIFAVIFALWVSNIVKAIEIMWRAGQMGPAFLLGLFWRRTTSKGAWAATLTSLSVWGLTSTDIFVSWLSQLPVAEAWNLTIDKSAGLEMYLPWQIIAYLAAGIIAGMVVSLLSKPIAREKLDAFYALIRTPVTPNEKVSAPCRVPEGVEIPPKRAMFPNTNWEILIPSRTSVLGFLTGVLLVVVIIYTAYLIFKPQ